MALTSRPQGQSGFLGGGGPQRGQGSVTAPLFPQGLLPLLAAAVIPGGNELLSGSLGNLFSNVLTGGFGSQSLEQNRPQYNSPAQGLGVDLSRPLGVSIPQGAPQVGQAAGRDSLPGTPQGVAQQMLLERERAFQQASQGAQESRGALGSFRQGLGESVSNLRGGQQGMMDQAATAEGQFQQAAAQIQNLPHTISDQVRSVVQTLRGTSNAVVGMARGIQENMGDFVVQKMEGVRTGIDQQFEVMERQAMDALYAQSGGVSAEERNAIHQAMALEKSRTIAQSYAPVLAEETARLVDMNTRLLGEVNSALTTMGNVEAGLVGTANNSQIAAAELNESLTAHRTAMQRDYQIASWNLGQFAEDMQLRGNEAVYRMIQDLPRPFLALSDVSNFLMSQYYGLVESENVLEQSQFSDVQQILAPVLGSWTSGLNSMAQRQELENQRDAQASASRNALWGSIGGGIASGAGAAYGGYLSRPAGAA